LDEEEEGEMSYTTPIVFRGTSSENAENWLRHATWWLSTTRIGQGTDLKLKLHQMAVLFQEEAQNWFIRIRLGVRPTSTEEAEATRRREDQQPAGTPDKIYITSWEEFEEAFLNRFRRNPTDRVGDIAALMQMRQSSSQTVEDFVLNVRRQGALVSATEQEMYLAAITGLRTELKAQIMQFDPTNLDEVIKRGKIAERYPILRNAAAGPPNPTTGKEQSQGKLDQILLALNELQNTPPEATQRQRSPTPPRVRFSYQGENGKSTERDTAASRTTWSTNRDYETGGRNGRPPSPAPNRNFERQEKGERETPNRGTYRGNFSGGNNYRGNQQRYERGNFSGTSEYCGNCGRGHGRLGTCPARGAICNGCGRPNHFKICCRSLRGRQNYDSEGGYNYTRATRPYRD
jgi:hypothetical protein